VTHPEGSEMRQRSGSQPPIKGRRASKRKARKVSTAARSVADLQRTFARELKEANERQNATAEVLQVINSSAGDLAPVFDAILEKAHRLCAVGLGALLLYDGEKFRAVAVRGLSEAFAARLRQGVVIGPKLPHHRLLEGARFAQVRDWTAVDDPIARHALGAGIRTTLFIPLRRKGKLLGYIAASRPEVRPFIEKEIALLESFAAQAVIAMENARLITETREALERQTATTEVLQVINSSPRDLSPVFDAILEKAHRLCGVAQGSLQLFDGSKFHAVAVRGLSEAFANRLREGIRLNPNAPGPHLLEGARFIQIPDLGKLDDAVSRSAFELAGVRTVLFIPLRKDGTLLGRITASRSEVKLFTEKEIGLLESFAAQAVIAIENARLFREVQAKTLDLEEALQQQTATADVLKVISRSAFDLKSVLQTLVESAARLCDADKATITRKIGGVFYRAETYGFSNEFMDYVRNIPIEPERGSAYGRVLLEGKAIHILDVEADPEYTFLDAARLGGFRTVLAAPILREGVPIGALSLTRSKVRAFTDKQIELVSTFADQAAIAIQNVKLFEEVQAKTRDLEESLQQQTATADVLKVISRSTFDLDAVMSTLARSARDLCGSKTAALFLRDGDMLVGHGAAAGEPVDDEFLKANPVRLNVESHMGRALLTGTIANIGDFENDPRTKLRKFQQVMGFKSFLAVPLMREGRGVGVFALTRDELGQFSQRQVELVQTFADQAVIAIENVRLFDEVQARTRELSKSLEELRATQDRLVQTQKLALLGQLTAGIAHEIKNPLNFVTNFSGISAELIDELRDTLKGVSLDDKARAEIEELADTLKGNFDKVVHHGRRADAIVKNMLQHSREGSGEHRVIDVNALVEESLNLAWHGARAERQGFEIKLRQSLDPSAGGADVFPQDIRRALLNLIANGFYATKRKAEANGGDYEPILTASTKNLGDHVEIRIRDNGTGVPPDVKEKMFEPFFTTKPAGEGTGLGLSISHDIIVKQHAGTIEVETQPGAFTEIRIILPRTPAFV
jgi:GAF domain-containing protein